MGVIGYRCAVRIGEVGWPHVGGRASPGGGPLQAIYAPPGVSCESAVQSCDVVSAFGFAPATRVDPPSPIRPCCTARPGYVLYYLTVMAGPVRRWCVTFDQEHEWLRR